MWSGGSRPQETQALILASQCVSSVAPSLLLCNGGSTVQSHVLSLSSQRVQARIGYMALGKSHKLSKPKGPVNRSIRNPLWDELSPRGDMESTRSCEEQVLFLAAWLVGS